MDTDEHRFSLPNPTFVLPCFWSLSGNWVSMVRTRRLVQFSSVLICVHLWLK